MVGMSYAAVPLYRLYCQSHSDMDCQSKHNSLIWSNSYFIMSGVPMATGLGGTAVAGHSSEQIESMQPVKDRVIKITFNADCARQSTLELQTAANEIYCFCFEEQRLNPHESGDMPGCFFSLTQNLQKTREWPQ
ncbi:unnamed protein product [Ranitomeya imitator]|uniref:Uncharacterized protein n=1 Tax=Ranitomeya imitator TaxID=111125 RepID=A0ABN9LFB7_9NEOB|nr:unnamed protein product [Ranitomeya imitator]